MQERTEQATQRRGLHLVGSPNLYTRAWVTYYENSPELPVRFYEGERHLRAALNRARSAAASGGPLGRSAPPLKGALVHIRYDPRAHHFTIFKKVRTVG